MPFSPTTFVNNQTPPLSAAQMNKLGSQYQEMLNDVGLTDSAVQTALKTFLVSKGQLTLNVYDEGAVDSNVTSSQTALDAIMAKAVDFISTGQGRRVNIQIPRGTVKGDLTITRENISVSGPGTLAGQILIGPTAAYLAGLPGSQNAQEMNCNVVGLTISPGSTRDAVVIRNSTQVKIHHNSIRNARTGVVFYTDTPIASAQKIVGCSVERNWIKDVTVGVWAKRTTGEFWGWFADNSIEHNFIKNTNPAVFMETAIRVEACDGLHVIGNWTFFSGTPYAPSSGPWDVTKGRSLEIFGQCNFVTIDANTFFEAGLEGIYIENPGTCIVNGNQVIWPGQRQLSSAIRFHLDSSLIASIGSNGLRVNCIVTDNTLELFTKHGVEFSQATGTTPVTTFRANIDNTYIYSTANPNTYYGLDLTNSGSSAGGPALNTISHFGVFTGTATTEDPQYIGPIQANLTNSIRSRELITLQQHGPGMSFSTSVIDSKSVTGANTEIFGLFPRNPNDGQYWGGRVLLRASSNTGADSYDTNYDILMTRLKDGSSDLDVRATGYKAGAASNHPSFTFDATSNRLRATPIGSTSGTFVFRAMSMGNLILTKL